MPVFLLPLLSKIAPYLIGGVAVLIASLWFIHHERSVGAVKCEAAVRAATDAEQARQAKANDYWQQWAAGSVQRVDADKARINDLLKKSVVASTANNGKLCLDAAATARMSAIGRSGKAAAPATAAGSHR